MKMIVSFMLLLLATTNNTFASSFDCKKALHSIEQAICKAADLSLEDEQMASDYNFLITQCPTAQLGNLLSEQKRWLTDMRKEFKTANGHDWLLEKYKERGKALTLLMMHCDPSKLATAAIDVKSLSDEKKTYHFPFIQTRQPGVAQRINDVIFQRLLDMTAPTTLSNVLTWLNSEESHDRSFTSSDFYTVRNNGRLLVLELAIEGCGNYCSRSSDQYFFDARDGREIHQEDLFSDREKDIIAEKLKSQQIKRAKAILAKTKFERGEREHYQYCLRDWAKWKPSLWPMRLDADGRLRFRAGTCSVHANQSQDALDNLDAVYTISALKPHLNTYARTLLLGEGDVRDPVSDFTSFSCKGSSTFEPFKIANRNMGVKSISAGTDNFHLLLQDDGHLWSWGYNYDGVLGVGDTSKLVEVPVLVGDDFVQAAAGQSYSAAIRRDGSLWTWGSNYAGRLGDSGTMNQKYPVKIGEQFATVSLDALSGLALGIDGTLCTWGGERIGKYLNGADEYLRVPKALMSDVQHMEFGPRGQTLALKKDGSLWVWGDGLSGVATNPGDPQRIPGTFSRLAGRFADAAYKLDGSLWAWGETLAAMVDIGGKIDAQPMLVGQDFVHISVAEYNYVVALKSDGSLWATHRRGRTVRLEPVGCDFVDAVSLEGPTVITLKRDGSLSAWANWKNKPQYEPHTNMFSEPPIALGEGFTSLFQVGGVFGSGSGHAYALKSDNSVWQWYPHEEREGRAMSPTKIFKRVPFSNNGVLPRWGVPDNLPPQASNVCQCVIWKENSF